MTELGNSGTGAPSEPDPGKAAPGPGAIRENADASAQGGGGPTPDPRAPPAEHDGIHPNPWGPVLGSPWGRLIGVLLAPRATFAAAAQQGQGFGLLMLLLAVEYGLAEATQVARTVFKVRHGIASAALGLWSSYVHYALQPGFIVFILGVGLYYAARRRPETRIDIWAAASALAYAWVPHTIWVAIGVIARSLGLSHALLPQVPVAADELSMPFVMLKAALEYGPTAILMVIATRTLLRTDTHTNGLLTVARNLRPRGPARYMTVAIVAVVGISAGLAAWHVGRHWNSVRPAVPGDPLPAITLQGLDGAHLRTADLHGQVLLVDFWATWCPPCVASMPFMQSLHEEFGERGFRFVSVNVEPESPHVVQDFIDDGGYTFPVYFDDNAHLQRRLAVQSYPTTFLVDRGGIIRQVQVGPPRYEKLRADVAELLRQDASP